ncbi:DEAD/DEAH box helicase [Actinoplanes derwentensis]|nr:DEAD/DEAH box helicase [Actinoplanes derwentensis]
MPATFFTKIDTIEVLRPEDTLLVTDNSPRFRRSRLFLEAVLRRTPLPRSERGLALSGGFVADPLVYQQRPAELALSALRPRILLADVVGLGKTLEIGMILAELVRRGRGDRMLVVTPQHILDQFQREMWTRFSIPLVRLDSSGLERIQREIPAGRNPFTYFRRIIISIDTLKRVAEYEHHLKNVWWDAVVIDESHNLIGGTSLRNRLARLLASHSDALLLASATPHNGDKRSFADLIRLLDPAAIADRDNYTASDIAHVYLRRTKISPEVRDQIGEQWADRGPSVPTHCAATPAEEAIFQELTNTWLAKNGVSTGAGRRLLPYTMVKAFLSSHRALADTVGNRLGSSNCTEPAERAALTRLQALTGAMSDDDSAKLSALVTLLTDIGVREKSGTRVVVFSERVATLEWLAEALPARLDLSKDAIRVMHGGRTDTEQQQIVEEFSLAGSDVRLLLTGDIASEGVNLHTQCHHLIHYDLPWSLIRIEQRNGRIDRYGQRFQPQFDALILTSATKDALDDRSVAEHLLKREEAAHRSLGTAEAVTGEYLPEKEERRLVQDLLAGKTIEQSLEAVEERDVLADLLGGMGDAPRNPTPAKATIPTLFESTEAFVDQALTEVFDAAEDTIGLRRESGLLSFDVPPDLTSRLSDLPRSYLAAQRTERGLRLRVTFDRDLAQTKLVQARRLSKTAWPDVTFVSDVHPMVEWLADKVLLRLGRQQAPVLIADVHEPTYLVQGVYCNRLGQPTVVDWMAVSGLAGEPTIKPLSEALAAARVGPNMTNPLTPLDLEQLQKWVPAAIDAARIHLAGERQRWDEIVEQPIRDYRQQLQRWVQESLFGDDQTSAGQRTRRKREVETTVAEQEELVGRLATDGEPLLRLLAVLVARTDEGAEGR